MNRSPKFSIIVPHHDEVIMLKRLLSSIPVREDIQVIVVDDFSSDKSRAELKKVSNKWPSYEFYFLNENHGGGAARNYGISKAVGSYLIFADSDDFFLPSFNDILDSVDNNYDIYYFNAISLDSVNLTVRNRNQRLNSWISQYLVEGNEQNLRFLFGEPWCKIIRRSLINDNNIFFEETKIHNDTYFSYMIGFHAVNIKVINICGYVIIDRKTSVSKKFSDDRLIMRTRIFFQKNIFLKKNKLKITDRLFLSSYWEYIKRLQLGKCFQMNKNLGISNYDFFRMTFSIIVQETKNVIQKVFH